MDDLYKYLVEKFEITDAVNFIQDVINNPGENEKIIKAGYYAMQSDLRKRFYEHCRSKGFNEDQASLAWDVFVKYNAFDVAEYIIEHDGFIRPEKILNTNALTDISDLVPNIDHQLLSDIISKQPSKGGITVGPGELFLCLFVQNCKQDDTKKGDVQIKGNFIEVKKGNQAMLGGRKNPASSIILYKNFKKYYPELYSGTALRGKTEVEKLLNKLRDNNINLSEFTQNILGYAPGEKDKKYFENDYGLTEEYIKFLQNNEELGAYDWLKSIVLYGAMIYQKSEEFDYLLMISEDFSKLLVLDLEAETYDDLWSKIKDHWIIRSGIYNAEGRNILPKINL